MTFPLTKLPSLHRDQTPANASRSSGPSSIELTVSVTRDLLGWEAACCPLSRPNPAMDDFPRGCDTLSSPQFWPRHASSWEAGKERHVPSLPEYLWPSSQVSSKKWLSTCDIWNAKCQNIVYGQITTARWRQMQQQI